MNTADDRTIWSKIDYELVEEKATDSSETGSISLGRSWKRSRFVLDLLGTLFWIYLVLKVFFFDVDRSVVSAIAQDQEWIVDYRFLIFLGLVAVAVVALGVKRTLFGGTYVLLFPLIVILWKIPKLLYKSKSWMALFATLHVIASVIANFKYVVVAGTLWIFSGVFILATDADWLLTASMVVVGLLVVVAVGRTIMFTAKPASFIAYQEKALAQVRKTTELPAQASLDGSLRDSQITLFNEEQQNQFLQKLQSALLVQRFPLFWAYQLDQYRRSPAPVLFTGLAYAWLVLQTLAGLTLINYGLFKIDPSAFTYVDPPSLVLLARYSAFSLAVSEINALQPHSDLANGIFLVATILGPVFLVGFFIGLVLSYRQKSQDQALRETIDGFRNQSRELDHLLRQEYDVASVEEAVARLEELRGGLLGLISFFSSRIPPGFEAGSGNRTA